MSVIEEAISKKTEAVAASNNQRSLAPIFLDDDEDAGIPTGVYISRAYSKEDRELYDIRDGESLIDAIVRKQRATE